MKTTAQVRAYSQTLNGYVVWVIECTHCGPLGAASDTAANRVAVAHMVTYHGAELVSQ